MAYQGTTAGSSLANPPRQMYGANMWGTRSTSVISSTKLVGQNVWLYNTTDGASELVSTVYFVDGFYLGMKSGDIIMGSIDTGSSVSVYMGTIGTVTTAGCGLASTGGFVSSTR